MFSREDISRLARLARIEVPEGEAQALARELDGILALVGEMRAVPTEGVEPMSHPQDAMQRLREDAVTESDAREKFQAVAPAVEDGLYLVPKVIE
jgi:aspartyl-tRNA(Asn)/glutamyl-tRNA(Gln) amidotransferase subunit C